MRIHKEGKKILRNSLLILLLLNFILIESVYLAVLNIHIGVPIVVMVGSILLYMWIIYFFRDPLREIALHEEIILSPADGKVVAINQVYEGEYFQAERIQISIFMSPFNVHVNRSPVSGILEYFKYHPGKYLVAFHPKSSTKNERTTAVVKRADGVEILFRQIAGFVARRIKFYPQVGDLIHQGDEVGFIKFGSRLDLFLPLNTDVQVNLGDQVKGGKSVIAKVVSD
ncbi:MAG: phosphatidylserine decarboxylase [Candidatus Amoebophilus sp. 36-38]|nr:MAG: phosphatidylserine decarboxylase [Candidatus Amoebophilus sp. 36-38]